MPSWLSSIRSQVTEHFVTSASIAGVRWPSPSGASSAPEGQDDEAQPRSQSAVANDDSVRDPIPSFHATLAPTLESQAFVTYLEHALPFTLLLLALFFVKHVSGIIQFVFVFVSMSGSTLHLQALIAVPQEQKLYKVMDVLLIVCLNIWALSLLGLPDANMWRAICFQTPQHEFTVWQSYFYVAVTPLIIKQWMVVPKVLSVLLFVGESGSLEGTRKQSAVITLLEYVSMAWADAVPVTIWFPFFLSAASGIAACVFAGSYVALKGQAYLRNVRDLLAAAHQVFWGRAEYGTQVTPEEAIEAGNQCPICQDRLREPLKLSCGHIYCDSCIAAWLDRERTCPMCRSMVRHDMLQSFGNGSTNVLPTLF